MGYLDYLALKYPHLVEVSSIGKSFEGRSLKIIKVSSGADKNGEAKPAIWIDAGMYNLKLLTEPYFKIFYM